MLATVLQVVPARREETICARTSPSALRPGDLAAIGRRMDDDVIALITAILQRAPQWVRHDLLSKEEMTRLRAEETLAAMIANGLRAGTSDSPTS
ncbi:DUF6771 family protein [Sphingobium sp.]|uniref:DUF6771 family protein n=1 Tax=Sphingobium sp. TaxID=1912891 RepID=UPI003B3B53A6